MSWGNVLPCLGPCTSEAGACKEWPWFWMVAMGGLSPSHGSEELLQAESLMELSGWCRLSYGFDNAQQYANFQTSNHTPDTKLGGADDLGIACAASVQLWYGTHPAPGLRPSSPGHQAASFAPKAKKLQKWRTWTALYIQCAKRCLTSQRIEEGWGLLAQARSSAPFMFLYKVHMYVPIPMYDHMCN